MKRTPFRYQRQTAKFVVDRTNAIVAHEPGLGKTACALLSLSALDLPVLVVCPASLTENWRKEIAMWCPGWEGQFSVLSYSDRSLPKLGPEMVEDSLGRKRRKDPKATPLGASLYRSLIVDEAHYLKSPKSTRSKVVCSLIRAISDAGGRSIALSGTLVPNRPIELWPLLSAMGITDLSWLRFALRYADAYRSAWGDWDTRGASNIEELRDLLAPHCIRFTKKQVLPELPPKTWRVFALDLPRPRQEKKFRLADLVELDTPVALEAMSDVLHLHGVRKVPLVLEHAENVLEGEEKLVLFAHHRDVLDALEAGLQAYQPIRLDGSTPSKAKQEAVKLFQEDPTRRVFLGQNQAAGVGHTLTAASHVVIAEGSWVPGDLEQMSDRCHRIGTTQNVTIDLLTIHESIDEHMIRRALEKAEVANAIVPESKIS